METKANITVIRPKDRNEWLEYRKSGIGSSELATYCGKQFISIWADFNLVRRR